MRFHTMGTAAVAAGLLALSPLAARQTTASQSGAGQSGLGGLSGLMGGGGGASGLLGGLMPNVGATGASNAAGVLGYCVRNKLVGSTSAVTSTLQGLTGRPGVTTSKQYVAGQQGTLLTGQGQTFSLDAVKGKVKTKVCDLVLQHAKSML